MSRYHESRFDCRACQWGSRLDSGFSELVSSPLLPCLMARGTPTGLLRDRSSALLDLDGPRHPLLPWPSGPGPALPARPLVPPAAATGLTQSAGSPGRLAPPPSLSSKLASQRGASLSLRLVLILEASCILNPTHKVAYTGL